MPTITLHSIGDVIGVNGAVTVVGSAPQWGDGSDSTYGQSSDGSLFSQLETLTLPAGATVTAVRARIRASATVTIQVYLQSSTTAGSGFVTYFTSDTGDLNDTTTTVPTTAATVDLVQSTHEIDQDPVTVLEAGGWGAVDTFGTGSVTVYEFTVFVDYDAATPTTTVAPPLRLTNRDDVFSSAPSLTRSRSRQGSNRLTGYL